MRNKFWNILEKISLCMVVICGVGIIGVFLFYDDCDITIVDECGDDNEITVVTGYYFTNNLTMEIAMGNRSINDIQGTFYHELAHHIWYNYLSQRERDMWNNMPFVDYPSEYAKKDNEENFAESFKYYVLGDLYNELQLEYMKECCEYYKEELK